MSEISHTIDSIFAIEDVLPRSPEWQREEVNIVVVDDHRMTAELLEFYLAGHRGAFKPIVCCDAKGALQECQEKGIDLVIMDVCLPDLAPMDFLSSLREGGSEAKVLIFSRWIHPTLCNSYIKAGVQSIVFKTDSLQHLQRGINTVLTGGRYFSPAIEQMISGRQEGGQQPLTEREQEALRHIAKGQSTKEMAQVMEISFKTAEKYRERLMSKLKVHDAVRLTHFAIRSGLVTM